MIPKRPNTNSFSFNFFKQNFGIYISICFGLLLSCSINHYDKAQAVRSLKVLNSDMVNLMSTASEMEGMKTLDFLYNQANAPIPFKKSQFSQEDSNYDFERLKGYYVWNDTINDFACINKNEFVDIHVDNDEVNNSLLRIYSYASEAYSSKPDFPTKITAKMFKDGQETLSINHSANVKDKLPEVMRTTIKGQDFNLITGFNRTKKSDKGNIDIYLSLKKGMYTLIDVNIIADIQYSSSGYFYNYIEFECNIFEHTISGHIDYKNIDPTSKNYSESFNKHATIEIFESSQNKVGDIVLASTGNNDLQEFKIKFRNNDQVLLKEYLPALNKLYNLKY